MKYLLTPVLVLALAASLHAHGGNYSGPGVTPPGSVGTGGKGAADTVPSTTPTGPATSGRLPSGGSQTPNSSSNPTSSTNANAASTATNLQDDLTSWRYWWYYNSKPYLLLKQALPSREVVPGSDDFFLGARHGSGQVGGVRPDAELVQGTIVPGLIAVLNSDTSQQELTSALISLSRLEGDLAFEARAEAEIAGLLGHGDLVVAEVAAISLGILGSDRSSFALVDLLAGAEAGRKLRGGQAVPARVRAFAAYGLGQIGQRTARPEVKRYIVAKLQTTFDGMDSTQFDVRVACLLSMGSVPLPADPDWQLPLEGNIVASTCREAQVAWLMRILADDDQHPFIRAHAPTALARLLKDAERENLQETKAAVVSTLLAELGTKSETPHPIVQSAALALGQLGDSDADALDRAVHETLTRTMLKHADQQTRNFAVISLAQAASRPGRDGSTVGLDAARKSLASALEHGSTMQRPWAAIAIGVMGRALTDAGLPRSPEMAKLVRATLEETRSPELTSASALALGIMQDLDSEDLLIEVLGRTSDTTVRGYAMISLGMMEARGSLPRIEAILVDSKYRPDLVQTAAVSLALMHDTELVPKLIEMLNSNSSVPAQGAICFSLGSVGDVRATQALLAMSTATEIGAVARGLAISALGLVADRFELPWNTQLSANTNYRANPSSLSNPDMVGVLDLF